MTINFLCNKILFVLIQTFFAVFKTKKQNKNEQSTRKYIYIRITIIIIIIYFLNPGKIVKVNY